MGPKMGHNDDAVTADIHKAAYQKAIWPDLFGITKWRYNWFARLICGAMSPRGQVLPKIWPTDDPKNSSQSGF